jgi:small subunit ribosomal protein S15
MAVSKKDVKEIVKAYGKSETDTGSVEVQIALLTAKIQKLSEHIKEHKKDAHSRRSLMILVGQRKSLLDYLNKNDRESYIKLIASLGIRK